MLCEMQSLASRIWTRVAVSISNDDNHYITGTSFNLTNHYSMQSLRRQMTDIYRETDSCTGNMLVFLKDSSFKICFKNRSPFLSIDRIVWNRQHFRLRLGFLFNGLSTFVGYLMPKPSLEKNSGGTIWLIAGKIRRFITFPRVFVRKWM